MCIATGPDIDDAILLDLEDADTGILKLSACCFVSSKVVRVRTGPMHAGDTGLAIHPHLIDPLVEIRERVLDLPDVPLEPIAIGRTVLERPAERHLGRNHRIDQPWTRVELVPDVVVEPPH